MPRAKRPSRRRKKTPEPTFDSDLTVWEQIVPPVNVPRYRKQDQVEPPPKLTQEQIEARLFAKGNDGDVAVKGDERLRLLDELREVQPWLSLSPMARSCSVAFRTTPQ
jgi:hypothetical protein